MIATEATRSGLISALKRPARDAAVMTGCGFMSLGARNNADGSRARSYKCAKSSRETRFAHYTAPSRENPANEAAYFDSSAQQKCARGVTNHLLVMPPCCPVERASSLTEGRN